MVIMCVSMEELLHQDLSSWSLVFENLPTRSVWVCDYVLSCLALNDAASQKSSGRGACPTPKSPRVMRWGLHKMSMWQDSVRFMVMRESPVWFALQSSSF
jgi:hypothetical protein